MQQAQSPVIGSLSGINSSSQRSPARQRLLTDDEKSKVIQGLKDKKKDLLSKLNKLPLKMVTLTAKGNQ